MRFGIFILTFLIVHCGAEESWNLTPDQAKAFRLRYGTAAGSINEHLLPPPVQSDTVESARLTSTEENDFYLRYVLPTASKFARLPQLGLTNRLDENTAVRREFDYIWNTNVIVLARLYLTNRTTFSIDIESTNCVVSYFNNAKINPRSIAGRESPEKAKFFSTMTNRFDDRSALEFAAAFFKAIGHHAENFHPPKVWHMGWGDPADKATYVALPFYEFQWLRKDVRVVQPGEVHHPRVIVVASGISGQVLSYQRLFLPIRGDFEPALPSGQPPLIPVIGEFEHASPGDTPAKNEKR